jgi:hypothetical protein
VSPRKKAQRAAVTVRALSGEVELRAVLHTGGDASVVLGITGFNGTESHVLLTVSQALELHRALGVEIDSTGSAR